MDGSRGPDYEEWSLSPQVEHLSHNYIIAPEAGWRGDRLINGPLGW